MLNIKNKTTFIIIFMISLLMGNAVMAANFTIRTQISYDNLHPDITHIKVGCNVKTRGPNSQSRTVIAAGEAREPVTEGAINKAILISLNDLEGADPFQAGNYTCNSYICDGGRCKKLTQNSTDSKYQAADNTSIHMEATGMVHLNQ